MQSQSLNIKTCYVQEFLYNDNRKHLRDAVDGKVVTRYQKAPCSYLTISDAKPISLSYHYANMFNGRMILRIDDSKLSIDNGSIQEAMIRDLDLLNVSPYKITKVSDYLDIVIEKIDYFIHKGFAYCDPTNIDERKKLMKERMPSAYRAVSVDQNMKVWNGMLEGGNQNCVVRAIIDYDNPNPLLRDPIIAFPSKAVHPVTGRQHKVYRTSDIFVPLIDSIEDVTHIFEAKQELEYSVQ